MLVGCFYLVVLLLIVYLMMVAIPEFGLILFFAGILTAVKMYMDYEKQKAIRAEEKYYYENVSFSTTKSKIDIYKTFRNVKTDKGRDRAIKVLSKRYDISESLLRKRLTRWKFINSETGEYYPDNSRAITYIVEKAVGYGYGERKTFADIKDWVIQWFPDISDERLLKELDTHLYIRRGTYVTSKQVIYWRG